MIARVLRSGAACTALLIIVLTGCATAASNDAPTFDLDPIAALPAELPIAWFAQNSGPYDPSLVGASDSAPRGRPLLIQDGRQVTPGTELRGDIYAALTERDSEGGFLLVRVIRHECDTRHFGPAGAHGVILAFSTEYAGPLPEAGHPWDGKPCESSGR